MIPFTFPLFVVGWAVFVVHLYRRPPLDTQIYGTNCMPQNLGLGALRMVKLAKIIERWGNFNILNLESSQSKMYKM